MDKIEKSREVSVKQMGWKIENEIFSSERSFTRLISAAHTENLSETVKALSYARNKFDGKFRDGSRFSDKRVPGIAHPLIMACHAHAMGIRDDKVLATVLLHDVCEDCNILPEELPFSDEVRHSVDLLTKRHIDGVDKDSATKAYYDGIASDSTASIVKVLDRCNNVSLMALSFNRERLISYVNETEIYVYPLLRHIKEDDPKYNDAAFLIKYQLRSSIETIKALLVM